MPSVELALLPVLLDRACAVAAARRTRMVADFILLLVKGVMS